jgi:hypothetical protein
MSNLFKSESAFPIDKEEEEEDGFRHLTLSEMEFAERVFLQLVIAPAPRDVRPNLGNKTMWEIAIEAALERTRQFGNKFKS